jgi:hypothetical protein
MESLARSEREDRARAEADAQDRVSGRNGRSHRTPRERQVGTRISAEHRKKLDWLAETTGKGFGRIFEDGIDLQVAIERRKTK